MKKRWIILAGVLLAATIAVTLLWNRSAQTPLRSLERTELKLRDGVLYASGESRPFQGELVEYYPDKARKLTIEIKDGRLHGRSLGWYPNGQMEVEERFLAGISHGTRTRWHENGNVRSVAQIEQGKVIGSFTEWHDNGQKAAEMALRDGKPDGVVEAWHPSGRPKSRSEFQNGELVKREFFPEQQVAQNDPQATPAE